MAYITERSRFAERMTATGGYWPEHFNICTLVDQYGTPVESKGVTTVNIGELDNQTGAPANFAYGGAAVYYALNGREFQLSFAVDAAALAPLAAGSAITIYFYQLRDGDYYLLDTIVTANPACAIGACAKLRVDCAAADGTDILGATHVAVAGNVVVADTCYAYFDYDLYEDDTDVELEAGDIEIGAVEIKDGATDTRATVATANAGSVATTTVLKVQPLDETGAVISGFAAGGATTDTPLAGETAEDGTARTGISLWKRIVNKLIDIKAVFTDVWSVAGHWLSVHEASPLDQKYSGPTSMGAAVALVTTTWIDLGAEIDVRGNNGIRFYLTVDKNDSTGIAFRVMLKDASAAADEYVYKFGTVAAGVVTLDDSSWTLGDADGYIEVSIPDLGNTVAFVQPQIYCGAQGVSQGTVAGKYIMAY